MQLSLTGFGDPAPSRAPRSTPINRGFLGSSREAGRVAAEACAEKAERVTGWDTDGAAKFILSQLRRHGQMSGEALTDAAKAVGFRPHDDRAFGSVYQRMVRRNEIRCVGFCERLKGHGTSGGRMWAAVR